MQVSRNVIHVGLCKTGTTFLQQNIFSKHSQIHYLGKAISQNADLLKELHRLSHNNQPDLDISSAQRVLQQELAGAPESAVRVYSEEDLSTYKFTNPVVIAQRLKALFGPSRILFVTRRPMDWLESLYFFRLWVGNPDALRPFDDWLRSWLAMPARGNPITEIHFPDIVALYEQQFGAENVLVLPYEQLRQDTDAFYDTVAAYMDIDKDELLHLNAARTEKTKEKSRMTVREADYHRMLGLLLRGDGAAFVAQISAWLALVEGPHAAPLRTDFDQVCATTDSNPTSEADQQAWRQFFVRLRRRLGPVFNDSPSARIDWSDDLMKAVNALTGPGIAALSERRNLHLDRFGYPMDRATGKPIKGCGLASADLRSVQTTVVRTRAAMTVTPPRTLPDEAPPFTKLTDTRMLPEVSISVADQATAIIGKSAFAVRGGDGTPVPHSTADGLRDLDAMADQKVHMGGTVIDLIAPGATLFSHWMFDAAPRIALLREQGIEPADADVILVASAQQAFHHEFLTRLGIPADRIIVRNSPHTPKLISADRLITLSPIRQSLATPAWIVDVTRQTIPVTPPAKPWRRIYLGRGDASRRRVVNEAAVTAMLERYGFETLLAGSQSVADTAQAMAEAAIVVAPHGAGLANIVFCAPQTKVLEFFSWHLSPEYWLLSQQCDLDYHCLSCAGPDGRTRADVAGQNIPLTTKNGTDIVVDVNRLEALLRQALGDSANDTPMPAPGASDALTDVTSPCASFVGFAQAKAIIQRHTASATVLDGAPPLDTHHNVMALPQTVLNRAIEGGRLPVGLYDEHGSLIVSSGRFRGNQIDAWTDGPRISRPANSRLLSGEYLYGGVMFPHFGHFLLETLARLWPALTDSQLPILFHVPPSRDPKPDPIPPYAKSMLDAMGIPLSRVVLIDQSLAVETVHVPTPAFVIRRNAYGIHREVCLRIAQGLNARPGRRTSQPLYISRTRLAKDRRLAVGEGQLEAVLEAAGFRIFHPQEYSLADQIATLSEHEFVFGCIGSALHLTLFTNPQPTVTCITHEMPNPNYLLCDKISGLQTTYLYAGGYGTHGRINSDTSVILDLQRILAYLGDRGFVPRPLTAVPLATLQDIKTEYTTLRALRPAGQTTALTNTPGQRLNRLARRHRN